MSNALSEALLILAVGMTTVFAILAMVVITGKVLIRLTNRIVPDIQVIKPVRSSTRSSYGKSSNTIDKKKLAAIVAAVEIATGGQGRIQKIEKV